MDSAWFVALSDARLLIDPWLHGVEVDYFGWFNTQWHRTAPLPYHALPKYNAVLITQKYPDHCHQDTLKQLLPKVVVAPISLEKPLRSVLPNATLHLLGPKKRNVVIDGVTITQLPTRRRIDPIYDAYVIDNGKHSLFMANHGFVLDQAHQSQLANASPCTVLFSPFNRYSLPPFLGGVVTPGVRGVLPLMEQVKPRWVVQTHDELKHAKGLVPALARIEVFDPDGVDNVPALKEHYLSIPHYEPVTL